MLGFKLDRPMVYAHPILVMGLKWGNHTNSVMRPIMNWE